MKITQSDTDQAKQRVELAVQHGLLLVERVAYERAICVVEAYVQRTLALPADKALGLAAVRHARATLLPEQTGGF